MKWFLNLQTRMKLIISFGIMILLLGVSIIISWHTINRILANDNVIYQEQLSLLRELTSLNNDNNEMRVAVLDISLAKTNAEKDQLVQNIHKISDDGTALISRLIISTANQPDIQSKLYEYSDLRAKYSETRENDVLPAIMSGKLDVASNLLNGIQADRYTNLTKIVTSLITVTNTKILNLIADSHRSSNRAIQIFISMGVISVLLAMIMVYLLTTSIANQLRLVSYAAGQIASGNLNIRLPATKRKDEIGTLMKTFSVMVSNLQQLTADLIDAITILGKSANEISTSTVQLSSSAAEMAAAVGETTSTIEEVKQTSMLASEKSMSVSDSSRKAADISREGRQSTLETNEVMTKVKDQMTFIANSMMRLSEQTQAISSIITTVDDLAQQSNILAVNASIEAEKAGDNGKGFRIVAQEIRNLSDQSRLATNRVREILSDVQKATNTAVLATEQGSKVVESGVHKSNNTGAAIDKLDTSIAAASQAAMQIAATSQQQLAGMEQAATAMDNIKQASTQNAESAKQLETAASNINDLGLKLQTLVSKYHRNKNKERLSNHE